MIYVIVAPLLAFGLQLGMMGLVLANSIQLTAHTLIMLALLYRRIGTMAQERLLPTIIKVGLASAAMGVVVWQSLAVLAHAVPGTGLFPTAARVMGAGAVGVGVYGLCTLLLGVGETRIVLAMLSRRLNSASAHRNSES